MVNKKLFYQGFSRNVGSVCILLLEYVSGYISLEEIL
jgi:hypothetical protein